MKKVLAYSSRRLKSRPSTEVDTMAVLSDAAFCGTVEPLAEAPPAVPLAPAPGPPVNPEPPDGEAPGTWVVTWVVAMTTELGLLP